MVRARPACHSGFTDLVLGRVCAQTETYGAVESGRGQVCGTGGGGGEKEAKSRSRSRSRRSSSSPHWKDAGVNATVPLAPSSEIIASSKWGL